MKPFKTFKNFNRRQKVVFLILSVTFVLMTFAPTLENPLLPPEATRHKISSGIIGMMFSSAAVISVLSSIAEGFLIAKFGPKIIMICGIGLNGIFNILFGLLALFKSTTYFTVGCFVCMGLDSVGQTAIYTATVSYGAKYFPTNMGFVMGTLEFYESIAEVMSFIIGGLLSEPVLQINEELEQKELWKLIFVPRVLFMEITILANGIAWSFLNSTLEPHLSSLRLTKLQVNLVFLLTSLTYGISSPLWGWASDRFNSKTWIFTSVGLTISGIGFGLLIGPAPFLHLKNTLWLNCVTLVMTSSALAMAGIPAASKILVYAIEAEYRDSQKLQGIVSSIISTTFSMGTVIGPLVGGYLLEKLGYAISAGLCGILVLTWGIVTFLYFFLICDKTPNRLQRNIIPSVSLKFTKSNKGIIFSAEFQNHAEENERKISKQINQT